MKRIVFVHIPKTAGTSVRNALMNVYEKRFVGDKAENSNIWMPLLNKPLRNFKYGHFKNRGTYSCISGHFPMSKYHHLKSEDWYFVTWLRDPASRVISFYNFIKNRRPVTNRKVKIRKDIIDIVDNIDVVEFSRLYRGTYKLFLDDLSLLDFVGFAETFESDLKRLEKFLGRKLEYLRENIGDGPKVNITESMLRQIKINQWEDYKTYVDAKKVNRFREVD